MRRLCQILSTVLLGYHGFVVRTAIGANLETNKVGQASRLPSETRAGGTPSLRNTASFFRVKPGFRFEVVAEAPMVAAPVAMAFDENGRLFVAEMREYPDRSSRTTYLGRVRLLEDTSGEGVFDSSTVYADNLASPSAVACYDGGVFAGVTPEVIYLKDSGRNGNADLRNVVLTGLGAATPSNGEALLNSFNWGLDSRIHGGVGPFNPAGETLPAVNDLSLDPRTLTLSSETRVPMSGLSFDDYGRQFSCNAAHPLRLAMYELRYALRNPFFARPPLLADLAIGTVAPSYARTEPLLRENVRTKASALPDTRGCVVYRGSAFPTNYYDNIFTADPSAHALYRMVLAQNGLEMTCPGRPEEFVSSADPSFRPVQIVNGPDGALYVADMRGGGEAGRIFRLCPQSFKPSRAPQLGTVTTYNLMAALAHADGWRRDTAARLIYERRDRAAVPLLTNMVQKARDPPARIRALHSLEVLDGLNEPLILGALRDPDARVRENAVLVAEKLLKNGRVTDGLWNQFTRAVADPAIRVRYQLAFTLGETGDFRRIPLLAAVLKRDSENEWIRAAVLSSLGDGGGAMVVQLIGDAAFRVTPAGQEFLRQLVAMVGLHGIGPEVTQVIDAIDGAGLDTTTTFSLLSALGEGLRRARSSLSSADSEGGLQKYYSQALAIVINGGSSEKQSVEALRVLGFSPYAYGQISDWLLLFPGNNYTPAVQMAAVEALTHFNDPRLLPSLLARWPSLTGVLRRTTAAALLSCSDRIPAVVAALRDGRISPNDILPAHANMLRTWPDSAVADAAARVLGPLARGRPEEVRRFQPALRLIGAPDRGRQIFLNRCAACHGSTARQSVATMSMTAGGLSQLQPLGPDLLGARRLGKARTLEAILAPNNKAASGYATCVVEAKDDELVVGLVKDEGQKTLTVQQSNGITTVWTRDNIKTVRPQTWSLMPEGLEEGLSNQDMADLLEFLQAP